MTQPLTQTTFERVQEHLSSEGVFLMGDAQTQGFPIRYASSGFENVYGYTGQEIAGKKCGDLIGGPLILSSPDLLSQAAAVAECSFEEAEARVRFLVEKAGEACRVMMANPNDRVGASLLLNRKKSGELFVCECLVLCLRHPSLNWSYTVGFQRDITRELSIPALFKSSFIGEYNRLLQRRSDAFEERRAVLLGVGGENVVQYLHEKALSVFSLDVWRTLRSELIASSPGIAHGTAADIGPPAPESVGGLTPKVEVLQQPSALAPATPTRHELAQLEPQAAPPTVAAAPLAAQLSPGELSLRQPLAGLQRQAAPLMGNASGAGVEGRQLPRVKQPWEHTKQGKATVAFLTEVGLPSCVEPLLLNGYDDMETLMEMSEEDMRAVGLARGHASKLKRRLRSLKCLQICAGSQVPTLLQSLHRMD